MLEPRPLVLSPSDLPHNADAGLYTGLMVEIGSKLAPLTSPRQPGGVALYLQIAQQLRAYVAQLRGTHCAIPSERTLAAHFGVTRSTVRQAIDVLVRAGELDRVIGVGTFPHRDKMDLQPRLTSFSEEMRRRGLRPSARVLSFTREAASRGIARELNLSEGQLVVRFRRLLLADDEPMSLDENFLPQFRVPGLTDREPPTSLYRVLSEEYGLEMEWGEDLVEAVAAEQQVARLLQIDEGAPLLKIQRHAFVAGSVVDYSMSYYRADRYTLRMPLPRSGVPQNRLYRRRSAGSTK